MLKKIICALIILIILFEGAFFMICINTGTKNYYSSNTELKIKIPKYAFKVKEEANNETYTISFIMFGKDEHIQNELNKIYDSSTNDYKIIKWSYDIKKFYKKVNMVYEKL